jgi:hypothetical protein
MADLWTPGTAAAKGRARYRFDVTRIWTPAQEEAFIRAACEAFPGSYEVDEHGEPLALPQMTFEEAL